MASLRQLAALAQVWASKPIKMVNNRAGAGSNIGDEAVAKDIIPMKAVKEFTAYAKANPGKLAYGSSPHLEGEMFKDITQHFSLHALYRCAALAAVPRRANAERDRLQRLRR